MTVLTHSIFVIPEVLSHILGFVDKLSLKQILSVNKFFHSLGSYHLEHSLKWEWDASFEQFQQIREKYPSQSLLKALDDMPYHWFDYHNGLMLFFHRHGTGGLFWLSHLLEPSVSLLIHRWVHDVRPRSFQFPSLLSITKKRETFLTLDAMDRIYGSIYINLTDLTNITITHNTTRNDNGVKHLQILNSLCDFPHWAPFWYNLIDSSCFDDSTFQQTFKKDMKDPYVLLMKSCVSVDEFYLIVESCCITTFVIYSFEKGKVSRFDAKSLLLSKIPKPNITNKGIAINSPRWLILSSIYSNIVALNLKTHQSMEFVYCDIIGTFMNTFLIESLNALVVFSGCNIVYILTKNAKYFKSSPNFVTNQMFFDVTTNEFLIKDLSPQNTTIQRIVFEDFVKMCKS